MNTNKALLLSPYDATSHQHWHQMLVNGLPDLQWTVLSLPAHHFYWRTRSNGLSFALKHRHTLTAGYDVLVATSMLDLATLRGLVPELASVPSLIYFHENQFSYPLQDTTSEHRILNVQLSSITTAWGADRVLFNSRFNKTSFLNGVKQFIQRMPDGLEASIHDDIAGKSTVLPVPIQDYANTSTVHTPDTDRDTNTHSVDLVWAHRWEFDKQPDVFFDALDKLHALPEFDSLGLSLRLHVMGQSFRRIPECFQHAKDRYAHIIETWGYQTKDHYVQILAGADIAISTALHDFQGLGMIEAIHLGCIPVAPNRVAYPEYIPSSLLYETGSTDEESTVLANKLYQLLMSKKQGDLTTVIKATDVSGYLDSVLMREYKREINALLTAKIENA